MISFCAGLALGMSLFSAQRKEWGCVAIDLGIFALNLLLWVSK